MSSAAHSRSEWWGPIGFGCWAAAVALAPSFLMKAVLAAPALLVPLGWWTLAEPSRWILGFFAAALLLPPLPIPMGDSGPHPSLLFAALGLLAGLLRAREWEFEFSGVHRAMLALFGILLASVGWAAIHSGAVVAAGSLARVGLFGISIFLFFYASAAWPLRVGGAGPWPAVASQAASPRRTGRAESRAPVKGLPRDFQVRWSAGEPRIAWLYWFATGSALFACLDFYFQFPAPAGYGPQFVWLSSGVYRRAQGFFYEASTLGNFCVFFLVMIAVALARPRAESPVGRMPLIAGGAVFFAALTLSYSRGSLLNLLVAMLMLAWLNRGRIRPMRVVAGLVAVCAAGLLTWKVFPAFAEMYWLRLSATAEFLSTATEAVLSGRLASWRTLTAWIAENPWQALAGVGYKTLPYTGYLGAPLVADNMYLSLLVETGVAGLASLVWLNVAILREAAREAKSTNRRQSFCGTWMLCFWAGEVVQMASGDLLTYWRVLPVYFWVLALAMRK